MTYQIITPDQFVIEQVPSAGTNIDDIKVPLFSNLKIRDLVLNNRLVVSPMCTYSSKDGFMTNWHLVHYGQFALHGAGLIMVESTAVSENGRVTPVCAGLWKDEHILNLTKITDYVHSQNAKIGIQLGHAGRKASTLPLYHERAGTTADVSCGGWTHLFAPSSVPWSENSLIPSEISLEQINHIIQDFKDAAVRALKADFDVIEIHGAHGYLIHQFLSPISNKRTDNYGGSFENRTRLLIEIIRQVRQVWPQHKPLFVRLSCTDWIDGEDSWNLEQTVQLSSQLYDLGVDFIDCSSGGNSPQQKIVLKPSYQVPFCVAVKKSNKQLFVGAVGLITTPEQANEIIQNKHADLVFLAREFLRTPNFALKAAQQLKLKVKYAKQYEKARVEF